MRSTVCPACQHKVVLPENTTSRTVKTMCPKCGELLPVPPSASRHPQEAVLAKLDERASAPSWREQLASAFASAKSLGFVVLALGLLSLAFLTAAFCLPAVVGSVGIPLSGVGLLLGLYGTVRGVQRRERDVLYTVAGVAICGLVLTLILTHQTMAARGPTQDGQGDAPTLLEQRNKDLGP